MDELARILTRRLDRPVVNHTELDGFFDSKLTWVPELSAPEAGAEGSSVFTAIREQLGLRLDAAREPVETLVIDAVARPSAN
jgi:uncharacterized protein (TIGR03435 family)